MLHLCCICAESPHYRTTKATLHYLLQAHLLLVRLVSVTGFLSATAIIDSAGV